MKKIKVGKHTIELYDSAELMPMRRYQRFNKFLMIDNEVGSDFADFNKRSVKAIEFLKKGMIDEAIKELDNRRLMVYNAFMEYSPRGRAFAILVKRIDGKEFNDFSDSGIRIILKELENVGISFKQVTEEVYKVKKKSKKNWLRIFLMSLGILRK